MRTALALCILGLTITLAPARVHAGTKSTDTPLRTVTVDELAALRTAGKAIVVDANGADTRQKYGVIPGAVLLPHYADYDVAKELPHDRSAKLVFYCANEKCMASHKAAEHATDAGYSDVSVLPAGIMGWKGAGQPTGSSGS
jgi:rhodanese-related sulfurtransferase